MTIQEKFIKWIGDDAFYMHDPDEAYHASYRQAIEDVVKIVEECHLCGLNFQGDLVGRIKKLGE